MLSIGLGSRQMIWLIGGWVGLLWAVVMPVSAAKVLIVNSQTQPVMAEIVLTPIQAGLKGVQADRVRLTLNNQPIDCQAEDQDLDGKITDQDLVYTCVSVGPGMTWLEILPGEAPVPSRKITIQQSMETLRAGWVELDLKTGQPKRFQMGKDVWKDGDLSLAVASKKWQDLQGKVKISDLPLRTRIDFLSEGNHPLQITTWINPSGTCRIHARYPQNPEPGDWKTDNHASSRPFIRADLAFSSSISDTVRYHWLNRSGVWSETAWGLPGYSITPFFAGVTYPDFNAGLGIFSTVYDSNAFGTPWRLWFKNKKAGFWSTQATMVSTTADFEFTVVRYSLPAEDKIPAVINNLYYSPQVYAGDELHQMMKARLNAFNDIEMKFAGIKDQLLKAKQNFVAGEIVPAMELLEQSRDTAVKAIQPKIKTHLNSSFSLQRLAAKEADSLMKAQAKDRAKPKQFIFKRMWGKDEPIDRLVRADLRLAEACQIMARSETVNDPKKKVLFDKLVNGSGETFRAGFGLCAGFEGKLFNLVWGYDLFEPLIEIGVKNFHFQAIRWTTHDKGDGSLFGLEGYDQLFTRFDEAGVTAVPQLLPWFWGGPAGWMLKQYADYMQEYSFEQAGVDGKIESWKERGLVRLSPEIWGSVPPWQQAFDRFLKDTVQMLSHHRCIVAWAVDNEFGASAALKLQGNFPGQAFHKYLKEKYQTVIALNNAWKSNYASFEQIPLEAPKKNILPASRLTLDRSWLFAVDPQDKGKSHKWTSIDFDDRKWIAIRVPGYWEKELPKFKSYDGVAWYRCRFTVPTDWNGKKVVLRCDGIDDDAELYLNGKFIRETFGFSTAIHVEISNLAHYGRENVLAVRVNDEKGNGGIYQPLTLTAESFEILPPLFDQPQRQLDREMFAQMNEVGIASHDSRTVHEADSLHRPAFLKEFILKMPSERPDTQLDTFLASTAHFGGAACDMYKSSEWYSMGIDMLRSANPDKPLWLTETLFFQPRFCAPESLEQWSWSLAVRGLRNIYFWGQEKLAYEGDCNLSDFAVGVAKLQHRFDVLAPVLTGRRTTDLAIYLPRDSQYLCDRGMINKSWQDLWRMFYALNVPTDFIDDSRIAAGNLTRYRCLVVPLSPYLPKSSAQQITEYVKAGGVVIMLGGSAVYDYQGGILPVSPGYGLDELFGIRLSVKKSESAKIRLKGDFTSREFSSDTGILNHHLELNGAKILLGDPLGHIGLTWKQVGKGQVLLANLDLGNLYACTSRSEKDILGDIVWDMLHKCGVRQRVFVHQPGVEAHLLEGDGTAFLVLINHQQQKQTVNVALKPDRGQEWKILYDLMTLEKLELKSGDHGCEIPLDVLPDSVRFFALSRE